MVRVSTKLYSSELIIMIVGWWLFQVHYTFFCYFCILLKISIKNKVFLKRQYWSYKQMRESQGKILEKSVRAIGVHVPSP